MKRPSDGNSGASTKRPAKELREESYSIGAKTSIALDGLSSLLDPGVPVAQCRTEWRDKTVFWLLENSDEDADQEKVDREFKLPLTTVDVEELVSVGQPSMVGKNQQTVLDEEVRKSLEITGIKVDDGFMSRLKKLIEKMRIEMKHPYGFEPALHKLIVYRPGDFFSEVRVMDVIRQWGRVYSTQQ